jgi:hypothetical protein
MTDVVRAGDSKALKEWLIGQPPQFAQALIMRVGLRILPLVGGRGLRTYLRAFRVSHQLWTAVRYLDESVNIALFNPASRGSDPAGGANGAITVFAAMASSSLDASGIVELAALASTSAGASSSSQIWTSVEADARWLMNPADPSHDSLSLFVEPAPETASRLAALPLWLKNERGGSEVRANLPDWIRRPWISFKKDEEAKASLAPWIRSYEARLAGRGLGGFASSFTKRQGKALDVRIANLPDAFWEVDFATSNAKLQEQIEWAREEEPPSGLQPPKKSLPEPRPATQFSYRNGRFDVIPTIAWTDNAEKAGTYHIRAREVAIALANRLKTTDAAPELQLAVEVTIAVLGDDVKAVQPDQLRMASRSVNARARAYSHPAAEFEISPESVAYLFELADTLADLQAIVRSNIEQHEAAIRQLDLTPELAKEAKVDLDLLADGLLSSPEAITERVERTFSAGKAASSSAVEEQARVAIESDRTLVAENFALAVARALKTEKPTGSRMSEPVSELTSDVVKLGKPSKQDSRATGDRTVSNFTDRVLSRVYKKGPDAIGDAAIQAAVTVVRSAPKTALSIAAIILLLFGSGPLALKGSLTIAWLAYEVRRLTMHKDS